MPAATATTASAMPSQAHHGSPEAALPGDDEPVPGLGANEIVGFTAVPLTNSLPAEGLAV